MAKRIEDLVKRRGRAIANSYAGPSLCVSFPQARLDLTYTGRGSRSRKQAAGNAHMPRLGQTANSGPR